MAWLKSPPISLYQLNKQVEQSGEFINIKWTFSFLNFIWMISKAQMQTVEDKTVISGLRWYVCDRYEV